MCTPYKPMQSEVPQAVTVRARVCQATCGACQAHARCMLGARTLLTLAGKEDLFSSVQFPHSSEYTLVVIVRLL
jgi:positive regulator of sigma E activity